LGAAHSIIMFRVQMFHLQSHLKHNQIQWQIILQM